MIMKKVLLIASLAMFSLNVFAQRGEKGPFLTNRASDNWFISVGAGVNKYMGEDDKFAKGGKRMAPALDISLGKWFTPSVGARFQYSGLKAKGLSPRATMFTTGAANSDGLFTKKFRVNFFHGDFMWNASNALGGYKAHRRWEFVPYAGFGVAVGSEKKSAKENELAFTAGLVNKIRLSNAIDLKLEFRGMLVNQRFDHIVGGLRGEGMGSVTLGLAYKFHKRGFDKYVHVAPADYGPYNNRISALESELASANARANKLAKDLAGAKGGTTTTTHYLLPDMAVFFPIGKATLSEKEKINVSFIAAAIKKLPAGSKVVLDGNADSVTGTKKGNMALSERRIKTVYDALVAAGVKPEQLEFIAHGDTSEPFDHNKPALNRVLIIEH
jgi:outer membrane protein OmpA-like peptidoglycan-associated protein